MKRIWGGVVAVAALTGAVGVYAPAQEKPKAEAKALMKKSNHGDESPLGKVSKALKAESVAWDDIGKQTKEMKDLAKALSEVKDMHKERLSAYQKAVDALDEAAVKKDAKALGAARVSLLKTCAGCHYGGAPPGTGGGRL